MLSVNKHYFLKYLNSKLRFCLNYKTLVSVLPLVFKKKSQKTTFKEKLTQFVQEEKKTEFLTNKKKKYSGFFSTIKHKTCIIQSTNN